MALLVSDSHQAEAFKLLTDGDDTERLVPLHRYNAEDEALRLATIHVATCYSWLLLPDNDIFEVIHQVLYFVQTSAVAGCYQCTAVSLATNEASTETFNDASAGETLLLLADAWLLLLANVCGIKTSYLCGAQGFRFCRVGRQDSSTYFYRRDLWLDRDSLSVICQSAHKYAMQDMLVSSSSQGLNAQLLWTCKHMYKQI